jgi:hypothetical protein
MTVVDPHNPTRTAADIRPSPYNAHTHINV